MKVTKGRDSFWWRLFKAVPIFTLTLLLTFILSREGVFRQLETNALDTQMRLSEPSQVRDNVVIVSITDGDYKKLFKGRSPLDPGTLKSIIDAIALGRPKVIGVDIDTSAAQFQELRPEPSWPPVIWARTGAYSNIDKRFHLFDVLGGQNPPQSGLVSIKQDSDGALRRYSRAYDADEGEAPSLPRLVATQFRPDVARVKGTKEDLFIQFAGHKREDRFFRVDASNILAWANDPSRIDNELIKDRIVLLGGEYAASDEYDTPLGWMSGVEVLAFATQTELLGSDVKPASRLSIVLLQVFDGFILLLLFQQFRPAKAIILSLVAIPFLSLVCSLAAFKSFAFWAYFLPILIAVLVQQLYDQAKEYRKQLVNKLYKDVGGSQPGEDLTKRRPVANDGSDKAHDAKPKRPKKQLVSTKKRKR